MAKKGWKKDGARPSPRGPAAVTVAEGEAAEGGGGGMGSTGPMSSSSTSSSSSSSSTGGGGGGGGILGLLRDGIDENRRRVDDMTMIEVLTDHPLIRYGKFVFVPTALYYCYLYVRLRRPEYASYATFGLVNLRPAMRGYDTPRQFLVVSSPMSMTHLTSGALRDVLRLEVGHETTTDASWAFVRDGSTSWMHGIRYMNRPNNDDGELVRSVSRICNAERDAHIHMGNFHPRFFGPSRLNCKGDGWDTCWRNECFLALLDEWGCGASTTVKNKNEGGGGCRIVFARSIHQVRNPMHVLEDLVSAHCVGGLEGVVAEPFLLYASALFPDHDYYVDSCIEATGTFLVSYLEAMMDARQRGDIDAYYRIENSSVCDVARAAGLMSPDTTVYMPNHVRIDRICDGDDENDGTGPSLARKEMMSSVEYSDEMTNSGHRTRLGWNDLRGGMYSSKRDKGDKTLQRRFKNMFKAFIYDEKMIPLEYESIAVQKISKGEL
ncbi:hypothetical protein ACHAXA_000687 [Cyclostephanos tholiformis]|uniref:Uncharacterized protein n=1 Tax=Cyclostephanos tholiformis TaxID=382380 RepID=A0ABD3R450_9STRA